MRLGRVAVALALAGAGLALAPAATGMPGAPVSPALVARTVAVLVPDAGDATLARAVLTVKLKPGRGKPMLPALRVANAGALAPTVSVAASTTRLRGKKNRFLLALVVVNRGPATPARAAGGVPARQVVIEARFLRVTKNDVRHIGVALGVAPNVLGGPAPLPAPACTQLLAPAVSPPARWLHQALDVDAPLVLTVVPKVVCRGDDAARIELETIVELPPVPVPACTGTFLPFDPTEVSFRVTCPTAPGRALASPANGFDIQLAGGRQITALLSPPGFSCSVATRAKANDTLSCSGTVSPGVTYAGNIRMSPGPAPGMGGTLHVFAGGAQVGVFAMTGP